MSASITSTDADHIPPVRNPDEPTDADYGLMGRHTLAYAGELHLQWENSTTTAGRLTHGPLVMASRWKWLGTNQTRNYVVTKKANETGGKDVLRLWTRDEVGGLIGNIYWMRAEAT
jgi:hypothetical protein